MTMRKSWMKRTIHFLLLIVLLLSFIWPIRSGNGSKDIVVVFDASGSMGLADSSEEGQAVLVPAGEQSKMDAAKAAVNTFLDKLSANQRVALIVFYDCDDIQVETSFTSNYDSIARKVEDIEPDGSTPLGDSLLFAWEYLKDHGERDHSWFIVVFTDGEETCSLDDPCSVAKRIALESQFYEDTPIFTIEFQIQSNSDAESELACIASSTGGDYIRASSAEELERAFEKIAVEIERPISELYLYTAAVAGVASASAASLIILQRYASKKEIRFRKKKKKNRTENPAEKDSIIWVLDEAEADEESAAGEFVYW
jgi:Mg-chelatase subunit ChlD